MSSSPSSGVAEGERRTAGDNWDHRTPGWFECVRRRPRGRCQPGRVAAASTIAGISRGHSRFGRHRGDGGDGFWCTFGGRDQSEVAEGTTMTGRARSPLNTGRQTGARVPHLFVAG